MGILYYTRHGQTTWNVENKICGRTDVPLTDLGRQQAAQLGQKLRAEGIRVDEILTSPLERAAQTAQIIGQELGAPVRVEPRLIEQCFGIYEGVSPRNHPDFVRDKQELLQRYQTGESMIQLCHRIYSVLDDVTAQPDKVYLLVAHNGISRAVHSYFYEMTNEEYANFGIHNCEFREYRF